MECWQQQLREPGDSARLINRGKAGVLLSLEFFIYIIRGGCAMPVELLVPVVIFALGVVIAVYLGSMGIERIVEQNKK